MPSPRSQWKGSDSFSTFQRQTPLHRPQWVISRDSGRLANLLLIQARNRVCVSAIGPFYGGHCRVDWPHAL